MSLPLSSTLTYNALIVRFSEKIDLLFQDNTDRLLVTGSGRMILIDKIHQLAAKFFLKNRKNLTLKQFECEAGIVLQNKSSKYRCSFEFSEKLFFKKIQNLTQPIKCLNLEQFTFIIKLFYKEMKTRQASLTALKSGNSKIVQKLVDEVTTLILNFREKINEKELNLNDTKTTESIATLKSLLPSIGTFLGADFSVEMIMNTKYDQLVASLDLILSHTHRDQHNTKTIKIWIDNHLHYPLKEFEVWLQNQISQKRGINTHAEYIHILDHIYNQFKNSQK